MMDENGGGRPGGAFGGLGGSLGGPAGVGGGMGNLSPYLNIDPTYLQSEAPEFIFNQEQKRGLMEKSFTAIGSSVLIGGAVGGAYGLYDGVRRTAISEMKGRLRRTQILNHTLKGGGTVSNALGSLAVIYSSFYVLISQFREEDDELKSCLSGAATGALYKSSAGIRKCALGGAFGLGVAALWSFMLKKDQRISDYV